MTLSLKSALPGLMLAVFALPVFAQDNLDEAVQADFEFLEETYLHLHQNPELSFYEEQSSALMASELRSLGFEVTENIGGYGLVGIMENGEGPTILLRADMDALPLEERTGLPYASTVMADMGEGNMVPVMHACGHDVHMTVFLGTARQMAARRNEWSGTLIMLGQPAEERGAGARMMIEDGLYDMIPRPDKNVALHTSASHKAGDVAYVPGWAMANVDSVDITVHGVGGHGSMPHLAKDPIVIGAQIVNDLQTIVSREISPFDSAVVTVGAFNGGFKHNIIPDTVKMQLTVRSYSDEVRDHLLTSIERIAVNAGRVAGLPDELLPEVEIKDEYTPSTYNDPELTERVVAIMRQEGTANNLIESEPSMGGEDFSRYGRYGDGTPSVLLWLGAVEEEKFEAAERGEMSLPTLHSPLFAPDYGPTLVTGVKSMTAIAINLLQPAE